jgi:hypothetical protein
MLAQRRSYKTSEPTSEYWHEVEIDGTVVVKGDVCTLDRVIGHPAGRYRFQYAEVRPSGEVMLMFYGPVACCNGAPSRSRQRYREVWRNAAAVRRIHPA